MLLRFLSCELVHPLTIIFLNEVDQDIATETLWFQQDGSPHILELISDNISMEYLQEPGLDGVVQLSGHEDPQTERH